MTTRGNLPSREAISNTMHAVVQVVALRQAMLGGLSPAWTGSGTIVHPSGIILTNCHVANPRAMGMSAPPADRLGIAITERSDQPPVLTYFAQILVQSPEIDLALLKIVSGVDGRAVSNLKLPYVPLGDSDSLELGDTVSIFGYPGIGGETVTFTSGSVSGFTKEEKLRLARAWIKTDATIAGGNSGGTAVDCDGKLIGVPTQAAAGTNIQPVDARPVVDTDGDGRVTERDTPMTIGGFINGLRPVNLAKLLLQKSGIDTGYAGTAKVQVQPGQVTPIGTPKKASGPVFTGLVFSRDVTDDGRPIDPAALLASGGTQLFASFEFSGMFNDMVFGEVWTWNGQKIAQKRGAWDAGSRGRRTLSLMNQKGLPDGQYHLILTVNDQVLAEGKATIGRRVDDTDTEISGQVVNASNKKGIPDALVIALKPGTRVQAFLQQRSKDMIYSSARTDRSGQFTFPQQLLKGQAYGLIVVARGYEDLAIESALRVTANAPEQAQLGAIALKPE